MPHPLKLWSQFILISFDIAISLLSISWHPFCLISQRRLYTPPQKLWEYLERMVLWIKWIVDDNLNFSWLVEYCAFKLNFTKIRFYLCVCQYIWFWTWLGGWQATRHYLNKYMLTPYGVIWGQWVNSFRPSEAIWRHRSGSTLAQVMACCLS